MLNSALSNGGWNLVCGQDISHSNASVMIQFCQLDEAGTREQQKCGWNLVKLPY